MALYNETQIGRFTTFFTKAFAIKSSSPAPQLSGEIQPSIAIFTASENLLLQGWETFSHDVVVAAVVGQAPSVRLRNPAGSNIVVVVELAACYSGGGGAALAADEASLGNGAVAADLTSGASLTSSRIDARGRPSPIASMSFTTNATPMANLAVVLPYPAGGFADFTAHEEWPLLPGDGIQVSGVTVNTRFTVSFRWRERFLEETERQ